MTNRLLWCLYSAGPSASCNNQSEIFVTVRTIWKFQIKLRSLQKHSHWYQPQEFPSIMDCC